MLNLKKTLSLQCLCLVITVHKAYALLFDNPALLEASSRQLHAAVLRSDTQRRADVLTPVYSANLTYSDGKWFCLSSVERTVNSLSSRQCWL